MFQEISDKVWFIQGTNEGRWPFSNSLFINDEKKLLIDTGMGRLIIKKLLSEFGQPDIIVFSHGHEDHIGEKSLFSSTERFIHELDKPAAESKEEFRRQYAPPSIYPQEAWAKIELLFKDLRIQPLDNQNIMMGDIKKSEPISISFSFCKI